MALATVLLAGALPSANAIAAEGVKYVPPGSEIPTNEAWTPCAPATKGHAECELIVAPPKAAEVEGYKYEGSGPGGGISAGELRSAYKLPEHGGAENVVAIVDGEGDPHAEADLKEYRKKMELPECSKEHECFRQLNEKGEPHKPTSTGWSGEISLDLDMVSAACPECHIVLLEAANEERGLLEADETAVKKVGAAAVTNSWNLGFEANNPANKTACETEKRYCVSKKEEEEDDPFLDHPGTPILFAGGDYGYAVRYPADSQYAVSVGGTALEKASNSRGWTEEVWSNSSYGDDQKGRGTGSGCSVYEPKPKFESEYSFDKPCTKDIENDVSADASPKTGVAVYDSYEGGWAVYGGTSASSPFVAGVEGLSTSHSRSLGAEAFWLAGAKGSLFDITKGNNGTCTPPTEDEYWCTAKTGYDGPTGNGTPDGAISTGAAPSVTTESATKIGSAEATLNGAVDPNGLETKYYFEYGETTSYGTKTAEVSAGSGTNNVEAIKAITGLATNQLYHFRIVATNSLGTSYGSDQTFTTTTWSTEATTNATGAPNNRLTGTSCTAATFCFATGYETYEGRGYAYGESWNGKTWEEHGAIEENAGMQLSGVSCVSKKFCMTVGSLSETNGDVATVAELWNGKEWIRQATTNAAGAPNNRLTAVSCTSTTFCFATGYEIYEGRSYAYGESWNGATWEEHGSIEGNTGMQLSGVSCVSKKLCMTVGSLSETNGHVLNVAELWNGKEWIPQTTPNATGAPNNRLTAVSCTSTTFCFATAYETYEGIAYPYSETWSGSSTWEGHGGIESDTGIRLMGVSCISATSCTAVGTVSESSGNATTVAEVWSGGNEWIRQTTPNEPGGSNELTSVSCASGCTAVGSYTDSAGVWTLAERSS
ncbi:MAG TPA: hypothetical protein VMB51_11585 [Solirubrobacteraceae bacterium]|nr:hypothetical protein [Solirubrobacteraceae bacterium]